MRVIYAFGSLARKKMRFLIAGLIAGLFLGAYPFLFAQGLLSGLPLGHSDSKADHPPQVQPSPEDVSQENTHSQPEEAVQEHPYGRPVKGPLHWEQDPRFLEVCAKQNATIRMGAFQTRLPDPLPGEEFNAAYAADLLAGTIIEPNQVFSMNNTIGPYTKQRGYQEGPSYVGSKVVTTIGGGVCKVATTLYNAAVLANLKIVERHPHLMQVPYVPPGQDAAVFYGAQDIKVKNDTKSPVVIWANANMDENTLYVAFYGSVAPPKVIWHHKILNRQKAPTLYRANTGLNEGEEKVLVDGAEGLQVKSWLTIEQSDSKIMTKNLGVDYYKPMPRVIERKSKT